MGRFVGRQFGQNRQKLHENYKITIFVTKRWGDIDGQVNFSGSGGILPVPPTRGNPAPFGKILKNQPLPPLPPPPL